MKTIPYKGKEVPIRKLATILGLERPTLARRVREYEAGRLTLEDVLSKKQLPPKPFREPIDAERLRSLLVLYHGAYPPVAAFYGVGRARVQQMVKQCRLTKFASKLREKVAAEKREKRRLAKPPKAAPFHVDTERLRSLLEQSGGKVARAAKSQGVPYATFHRAVVRAGLAEFVVSLREKAIGAKQDARRQRALQRISREIRHVAMAPPEREALLELLGLKEQTTPAPAA